MKIPLICGCATILLGGCSESPSASQCLNASTDSSTTGLSLMQRMDAECPKASEISCDRREYSPDIQTGRDFINECLGKAAGQDCFMVAVFRHSTKHLLSGGDDPRFSDGGAYNHSYYSCYLPERDGRAPKIMVEARDLRTAVNAIRTKCGSKS